MMLLNPMMAFTGINIAIQGLIVPIVVYVINSDPVYAVQDLSDNAKLKTGLHVMIVFGVGELIGAIGQGQMIDKLGSKLSILINLLIMIVTVVITCLTIHVGRVNALIYFLGLFWGL